MFKKKQEPLQPSPVIVMGQQPGGEQDYNEELPAAYQEQTQDPNFLLSTLDTRELVNEIEMRLKGYHYNFTKKEWTKEGTPLMKEEGIDLLVWHVIHPHFNKHMVLSYLSKEDINRFMIEIRGALRYWIVANYKEQELELCNFDILKNEIDHSIYSFLMRAREGKEHHRIKGGYSFNDRPIQEPKKGFFKT